MTSPDRAGRFDVDATASTRASRSWWDTEAEDYLAEHGDFLGGDELIWGPEGWSESELGALGELRGLRVLEFGAGAAQAGRWVRGRGATVVSTDISHGMLRTAERLNSGSPSPVPLLQCDAARLPFEDASFDIAFSAFGAVPFIADTAALMRELARVTRPGGRVAFSTTHPIRWCLPDVPDSAGLTVTHSYFDTTPYAEAAAEEITYVEHHRTLEQRIREMLDAGLAISDVREPEWKTSNTQTWGGWSPLRGRLIPGTLILVARRPC